MMKWRTFTVVWVFALALLLFAKHHGAQAEPGSVNSILDLTPTMSESSLAWNDTEHNQGARSGQHGSPKHNLSVAEPFGTQIDAPAQDARGMWTVDQIPAERLVRPLAIINVSRKAAKNPDYLLTVEDIAEWEDVHGHIPQGAVVMIRTGWGERWNNAKAFRNADDHGQPHFPGFSLEAAQFLVDARYAVGLGTDTMSVDAGQNKTHPVHQYSATRSVYHLENVANLEITPEAGATLVVAPAKFENGSGAPARLLAMLK